MAGNGREQIEFERHEAKYLIHPSLVPKIREYIRPFTAPDDNATGDPPEYVVTTLQLDSPDLTLYRARDREALDRFKLRVRTYGTDGTCPIFLEVKRKLKGVIAKSRAILPAALWGRDVCLRPDRVLPFRKPEEQNHYLEFVRLVRELHARPVVRIRYWRESYFGTNDSYARVTFDRRLCYQPAHTWSVPGEGRWWSMDSVLAMNRPFSPVVLELKTLSDAPRWMVDLTREFDLVRVGFCKYSTAIRLESLFEGAQYSEASEPTCSE